MTSTRFSCADCGLDQTKFYGPMLNDEVWDRLSDFRKQYLCSLCVEGRLGRPLEASDLKPCGLTCIWWGIHRNPNHVVGSDGAWYEPARYDLP